MPLPISGIPESQIVLLKDLISKEYGQSISSKTDCDKLSELIETRTSSVISVNTLRRFFNVMPTSSKPSTETLNILSSFCGHKDFYGFQQSVKEKYNAAKSDLTLSSVNDVYQSLGDVPQFFTTLNWLIQLAFRDQNTTFLKHFFVLDAFKGRLDYTQVDFKKVLMTLGLELQSNPKQFDILIGHYAGNPVAQALYFECFVDYDFLAIKHHHAIRAYSDNRKDNEAQLFSLCILFLHSFLLRDREGCSSLIKKINAIDFSSDLHPFPAGRKMACNILFQAFYLGGVKPNLIQEVFNIEKLMPRMGSLGRNTPGYHAMVADAFAWSGLHREAIAIIELAFQSYTVEINYNAQGLWGNLNVTYGDALLKAERVEESREVFYKINASHFDVHIRNFSLMHYYRLGSEIHKQNDVRMAASFKRSALEIAKNHKFKFFETLYA